MSLMLRPWRLLALLLGGLAPLLGGCQKVDLAALQVTAEVPPALAPGQSAEWRITVTNTGQSPVVIQDLDIAQRLLAGAALDDDGLQPAPDSARDVIDYRSFRLDRTVEPGVPLVLRLAVTATVDVPLYTAAEFVGDIDVCVDNFRQQSVPVRFLVGWPQAVSTPHETAPQATAAPRPEAGTALEATEGGPPPTAGLSTAGEPLQPAHDSGPAHSAQDPALTAPARSTTPARPAGRGGDTAPTGRVSDERAPEPATAPVTERPPTDRLPPSTAPAAGLEAETSRLPATGAAPRPVPEPLPAGGQEVR